MTLIQIEYEPVSKYYWTHSCEINKLLEQIQRACEKLFIHTHDCIDTHAHTHTFIQKCLDKMLGYDKIENW